MEGQSLEDDSGRAAMFATGDSRSQPHVPAQAFHESNSHNSTPTNSSVAGRKLQALRNNLTLDTLTGRRPETSGNVQTAHLPSSFPSTSRRDDTAKQSSQGRGAAAPDDLLAEMDSLMNEQAVLMNRIATPCPTPVASMRDVLPPPAMATPPITPIREIRDIPLSITVYVDNEHRADMTSSSLIEIFTSILGTLRTRFLYCDVDPNSKSHWMEILPDSTYMDTRSCRDLAQILQGKFSDKYSKLKRVHGITRIEFHLPISDQPDMVSALNSARSVLASPKIGSGTSSLPMTPTRGGRVEMGPGGVSQSDLLSLLGSSNPMLKSEEVERQPKPTNSPKANSHNFNGLRLFSHDAPASAQISPAGTLSRSGGSSSQKVSSTCLRTLFEALDSDGDGSVSAHLRKFLVCAYSVLHLLCIFLLKKLCTCTQVSLHDFVFGMQRNADLIIALRLRTALCLALALLPSYTHMLCLLRMHVAF